MPAGVLVTVPPPVPFLLTFSVCCTAVNVAVTDLAEVIETVQVFPDDESQPLQLVNVEPALAVAVNVTEVPLAKLAEQVAPQLIPEGLLVTVPVPLPAGVTVKLKFVMPPVGANATPRKAVLAAAVASVVNANPDP